MPPNIWSRARCPQSSGIGLPKLQCPAPNCFERNINTTFSEQIFDISVAEGKPKIQPDGVLNEQVDVLNISTGARFTTYAIEAPRGSREIAVNGAAARLVQTGDKVIVVCYCQLPAEEARNYHPSIVVLGEGNDIERQT